MTIKKSTSMSGAAKRTAEAAYIVSDTFPNVVVASAQDVHSKKFL
jgi:hypothetical protein